MAKKRLDVLLFDRALAPSREAARRFIMAGQVFANGEKADKPGQAYDETVPVEIRGGQDDFVSRGGKKLEKALGAFGLSVFGKVAMDVGASTGGFTDCLLQNGAAKVFAVDVGYGQLDWKLRQDARVVILERTNIRHLSAEKVQALIDILTIDVSFISLGLVLPAVKKFLANGAHAVCLVKPQFEAGRENVGKGGVVRDKKMHVKVLENALKMSIEAGFTPTALDFSPIKGPKGNIEFLLCLFFGEKTTSFIDVAGLVERAHAELNGD